MSTLRGLLVDSKDGEWGKGEAFAGSVETAVIRGTDFASVRVGDVSRVPVRHLQEKHAVRKQIQEWDIVLETAGGTNDQPTGRTLLITPSRLAKFERPVTCSSFARYIRIDKAKANPAYVFWLLQAEYASGRIRKFNTQHTGVARFQFTTFADTHELTLPPRPEQDRVAGILSAYDDLLEVNHRRITVLEEIVQQLFQQWFVRFQIEGHQGPARGVDGSLVLPIGWEGKKLTDWAVEVRDAVLPSQLDPGTPYVGLEHLPRRSTTLSEFGRAESVTSTKLRFQPSDILFGKIRPYFHKVAFAACEGVTSSDTIVIRPREDAWGALVLGLVSSEQFVAHAVATSNGTKMPRADWKVLKEFPLLRPPKDVLTRFNAIVEPDLHLCAKLAEHNARLRVTRNLLLPKIMSGEVRVAPEKVMEAA